MANLSRSTHSRSRPTFQLTNCMDVKLYRKVGEWIKGRWVEAEIPKEIVIEANVQPLRFHEIMQLPESDRTKEWIKLYTTDHVVTAEESAEEGNLADEVEWQGHRYKVMQQKKYVMGVLDHYHVLAAREPVSAMD